MKKITALLSGLVLCLFAHAQKGFSEANSPIGDRGNTYQKVSFQWPADLSPSEMAEALLGQFPELAAQGYGLELFSSRRSPYARHLDYRQTWQGHRLYYQGLKVHQDHQGRVYALSNNLYSENPVAAGSFVHTASEAEEEVRQNWTEGLATGHWVTETTWLVRGQQLIPAYRFEFDAQESVWEALLDARNLSVLVHRDLGVYHHRTTGGGDTTGTARVFNPDPLSTSGNIYGATSDWRDNGDNDNPSLNGERQLVTLKGLTYDGVVFRLDGPYVTIQELESPATLIATSPDGNFDYTRSQQGFEDVMCYYHIDTFQRYIQALGFDSLCNKPLRVDAHGLNGQDNSHFVPSGSNPRLGFGEGCVDDAEDADVIIHEYGHALSYDAAPGTNTGTERQGLDEGYGDYFAASYSRGLTYSLWKNTFTWDGHNECWDGRSASDPTSYPPPNSFDFYVYGSIWASTLMEVYQQIGKEASDAVVFQALYGSSFGFTLNDAAHAVLDADTLVFGGAHTAQYQAAFCNRGIFTGAECVVANQEAVLAQADWSLSPNPSSGEVVLSVRNLRPGRNLEYELFSPLGQQLVRGAVQPGNTLLNLEGLPSGIYLVVLKEKGEPVGTRKLVRTNTD